MGESPTHSLVARQIQKGGHSAAGVVIFGRHTAPQRDRVSLRQLPLYIIRLVEPSHFAQYVCKIFLAKDLRQRMPLPLAA